MGLSIADAAARLAGTAWVIEELVTGVDEEQARWKPAPERWSILEVVNHLYDEERDDFRFRFQHLLERPDEPVPPIDPPRWAAERRYNERELGASLESFLNERRFSLAWLETLDVGGRNGFKADGSSADESGSDASVQLGIEEGASGAAAAGAVTSGAAVSGAAASDAAAPGAAGQAAAGRLAAGHAGFGEVATQADGGEGAGARQQGSGHGGLGLDAVSPSGRRAGDLLASWVAHDLLHVKQIAKLHYDYWAKIVQPYAVEYAGEWR